MKCPHCGDEHKEDAKFCPKTGKLLDLRSFCPHCHAAILDQSVFCPACGNPIQQDSLSNSFKPVGDKPKSDLRIPIYIGMIVIGMALMVTGIFLVRSAPMANQAPGLSQIQGPSTHSTPTEPGAMSQTLTPTGLQPVNTATTVPTATSSPVPSTPTRTPTIKPSPSPNPILGMGATRVSNMDGMTMVFVPAGNFYMGSDPSFDIMAAADQTPIHTVYLDAFWVDKTEITNQMYQKCVETGVCRPPETNLLPGNREYYGNPLYDNYPVVNISLADAQKYCAWVGRQVPTEAQWEKAARGNDKRLFPWGNLLDFTNRLNYGSDKNTGTPSPVGSFPAGASPYGALDMAGNVFEWVTDKYDPHYYANGLSRNPTGPVTGDYGVVRGGSWVIKEPAKLKTSYRLANPQTNRDGDDGFRCVKMAAP